MTPEESNANNNRENFARTTQEVPLFPFRTVSTGMDEMEQVQIDFVQQAGMPSAPPDVKTRNQQSQK
ncbi:MAG TPA: hypothetical protein VJ965_00765 [Anaerolineales bacterium]|nr:hypothetical protein [Anaerolineales bacterium]